MMKVKEPKGRNKTNFRNAFTKRFHNLRLLKTTSHSSFPYIVEGNINSAQKSIYAFKSTKGRKH